MRGTFAFLALVVLVQAGCYGSSSGDSPTAPMGVEDEGDYVRMRSMVELSYLERCCEEAGARDVDTGYMDAIRRGLSQNRPARDSGARYDAQAAADCLAELAERACFHPKEPRPVNPDSACGRIYRRGERALGERCESYYECVEQNGIDTTCGVSEVTSDGILRSCQAIEFVGEGEPCESQDALLELNCQWPLICHPETAHCVARAERGEECITGPEWGDTCATGSVCDRLDTAACIEPTAEGEPCEDGERCENLTCAEGLCRPPIDEPYACIW